MSVDAAVQRLQALSLACTSVDIKKAPDYPIDSAAPCPFSIAHITGGSIHSINASAGKFNPTINVDFLFSRTNLALAYKQIDALVLEYAQRLLGDPRLNNTVETIVFPVTFDNGPTEWDDVVLQLLSFHVTVKTLETPTTTA